MHHLGAMVGEADVDALAELPMPVLLDWQSYMAIMNGDADGPRSSKGVPFVDPMQAIDFFRKRYG